MNLALVVAAADNDVIGVHNTLPWRLPEDLKRFKALTMGKPIIMGRKTFDSIGKPLPGRTNIVVTRQPQLQLEGCVVVASVADALRRAAELHADEALIIGGAQIYREVLPQAHRIYLTRVHAHVDGDAHLPALNPREWRETAREDYSADERHAYAYSFIVLERAV